MKSLPSKYILSKKPTKYFQQGLSHCGVYCVKGILSAYGKDDKAHPKDYHTNWIGRNLFSFATGEDYYDKIFASYGITSETKSAVRAFLWNNLRNSGSLCNSTSGAHLLF